MGAKEDAKVLEARFYGLDICVPAGKFEKRKQLDAAVEKFHQEIKANHERVAVTNR